MKKSAIAANALFAVLAISSLASCSSNGSDTTETVAPKGNDSVAAVTTQINIRFINEDTISANYNLAKDFKEQAIREYSKLENARQARANEIQKFGSQIEQKMKSNGYLSEASYNADMAKFNKMQEDAQNYLANMQRNSEQQLAAQQQQLTDSINAFIKEYNATKKYDAILYRAAGVYFDPSLDITDEVLKGLNARYNKVKK
ncbi:MAG: OmpH family outer membrane protein [Paramuribaculum sp.]|nr:OmpH family outer membrane protein [Paramuribaculum sp.]